MKKNYALIVLCLLLFNLLLAQNKFESKEIFGANAEKVFFGAEHIWLKQENIVPTFIQCREDKAMSESDFLFHLRKQFHLAANYSFKLLKSEQDELNYTHKRFQLEVNHIPVKDGIFILHLRGGKVIKYNGYLFTHVSASAVPSISESSALSAALADIKAKKYKWDLPSEEAFLKIEQKDPTATFFPKGELVFTQKDNNLSSNNFVLCWKFDVYAHEPMGRFYVYVDANTGAIINKENRICTADASATAITAYRGSQTMTTDSTSPTNFRLRETARGLGINTYDLHRTTSYGSAIDFTDSNNVWNNINANKDQYAPDAHWGAEKTYDFYALHGRSSIDDAGFALNLYVHYSTSYLNAFWDGTRMTFGDGSSGYTPLTSLDITGHEITHGLDQFTAGLNYSYESGALNESFSDIFGNAIEFYADSALASWLIGEDIGSAFRSMSNPNTYGQPDTYHGTSWYYGSGDAGGVHTNSGVQNYWYYLLAMGGSGTNDIGSVYNVTALGRNKANDIAWRNLVTYLTPGAQHVDARFYAIQSAIDLYGACTPEVQSTTNAWYAVGVGPAYTATVTASFTNSISSSCSAPLTVNFSNYSFNADTFTWDFGDGTFSTSISPTHTYTALGSYTVTLIASGGACGSDTISFPGLINIDTALPCVVILPSSGSAALQTECTGTVYDNGGQYSMYSDNTNSSVTISPTGAATVTLSYTQFRMENTYDFVNIYDGPSTASPLIRSSTGYSIPGTITSSGPSITIQQTSDESVTDSGFAIIWSCNLPAPSANFIGLDSTSCTGVVSFTDQSTGSPVSWKWYFGDGDSSTAPNPSHTYLSNGIYTVTLTITNSVGVSSSKTKIHYIHVVKPAIPITTGASRCGTGSVTLSTSPISGTIHWYAASTGGSSLDTGTSFTTPSLSSTTTYYAENVLSDCGDNSLSSILSNLNTHASTISASVPGPVNFTMDGSGGVNGNNIFDGGFDMYDGGNFINTNFLTSFNYSDNNIISSSAFGTGGRFFTRKINNMFVLAADMNNVSTFYIRGDNGADGAGTVDTTSFSVTIGCETYTVFLKRIYGSGDPSINQMMIIPSNPSVTQTYSTNTNNGNHDLLNLNTSSRLYYLLYAGGGGMIVNSDATMIANTFLTQVSANVSTSCTSTPRVPATATINPTRTGSISASICSGSSYLFNGVNRTTAGTYLDTFLSFSGCDSVVTLNLSVTSSLSGSFNRSICAGSSFMFNGLNRTSSGSYLDTLVGMGGCDSIVTLHLTVLSPSSGSISVSICSGGSYLFNGVSRTVAGIYLDTLNNIAGCDSIVTLDLALSSSLSGSFSRSICPGSGYVFNGINRTVSGIYLDTLSSSGGCDSIVTLNLTVLGSCALLNDAICRPLNFATSGVFHETSVWNLGSDNPDCDTLSGNSTRAGVDLGEPLGSAPGAGGIQRTMWYFMNSPTCAATSVRFSTNTSPTDYNTRLTAYHRVNPLLCFGPYTELASSDDAGLSPIPSASSVLLTPGSGLAGSSTFTPGAPIYVQVSGYNGDAGNYGVIVDVDAPDITVTSTTSSTISVDFSSAVRAYGSLSDIYLRYRRVGDPLTRYTQIRLSGSASTGIISGLGSGETYDVWAMYRCTPDDRWVSKKVTVTTTVGCSAPLAGPVITSISGTCNSVQISWTPSSLATRYVISWRRVGSSGYTVRTVLAPATTFTTGAALFSGTAYQFWVTTVCSGGAINTSPITTFTTCSSFFAKMATTEEATVESEVFTYNDHLFNQIPINTISAVIYASYPETSEVNLIKLDSPDNEIAKEIQGNEQNHDAIHIFPNPASTEATITYTLPTENEMMTIKVMDAQGRCIQNEIIHEPGTAGKYILNIQNWSSGIYFIKVQSNNFVESVKLVVDND